MAAITLLQKLQKLFGVKTVSSMMGNTSNVRSLGQGVNNSLSGTFSKKYLKENPERLEEAAASILESLPYAFGTKDARQIKNFENNVNTLFDFKFPQSQSEGKVIDLGSKQQVTGKGLESLKKSMGLPEGVDPNSPMGSMLSSTNRINKMGKDMETKAESAGDIFMDLMKSSAPPVDRKKEGLVRTAAREFLNREIKLGKIKLQPDEIKSIIQPSGGGSDPIDILRTYYGEDSLEAFDGIANKFMNTEKYSDFNKIIDENIDPSFLKPRKDQTIKQSYSDQEMKDMVNKKEEDLATKLKDYDGDPDAMAEGGIAGQLYLNEGGRAAYGKGGLTRRAFLQMMGGAAATGAALKTGLGGLIKTKGLSKIVTPTITKTAGMPDWFPALVKRAWTEGTDVTKKVSVHTDGREAIKRVNIKGTDMDVVHDLKTGDVNVVVHGEYGTYMTADNPKTGGLSTAYDEGLEMYYKPASGKNKKPNFEMNESQAKFEGNPDDADILTEGVYVNLNSTKADLKSLELYAKDKTPSFKDNYRIDKKNKETQNYMENPHDSPEVQNYPDPPEPDIDDFAIGGRVGFVGGGPVAKAAMQYLIDTLVKKKGFSKTLLDNVSNQKNGEKLLRELYKKEIGKIPLTTADKAPIPESTVTRDLFKDANKRFNTNIEDRASAKIVVPENKMTKTMINEGYDDPIYFDSNALDMFDKPITMDKEFFDKTREQIMKQINEQNRLMVPRSHGAYRDLQSSLRVSEDRLTALNITEEVGGNIKMFDKLRMKNGVKLNATPLSKFEYLKATSAKNNDLSGIDNLFDKDGVLDKDAVLRDITKSVAKTKKSKIVKTKTPNKALLKAMDEVGGSASGDMKYDADILADEYAFQLGLIEEGGDVTDIVDQRKRMDLYDEAYSALSGQFLKNREIKKMQQFSEPTETLKGMKDTGTIDISDPTIAEEFTTFLRENDPEGYKNLEQKIQLDNFDPKDRKGSAKGGLAGVLNI